ncbi:MAG: MBOAT family O-acyltransferase [Bdellovibrionales bacterium]
MLITSFEFWLFFLGFCSLYFFLPRKGQWIWLAAGNIFFLSSWGLPTVAAAVWSLSFHLFAAYSLLQDGRSKRSRLSIACLAVAMQILLIIFSRVYLPDVPLTGLSYFSLMLVAFTLDCYWKRYSRLDSASGLALGFSFFPLMSVGPIQPVSHFLPQLQQRKTLSSENLKLGLYLIARGFFKVTTIANVLKSVIQHDQPLALELAGGGLALYGFLAYFQLYADFSGAVDIVRGISKILGFDIVENFNQPYLAAHFSDIWQRWHISLTTWLRHYVFLPLLVTTRSLAFSSFVVILLVGAWHGLGLDYLLWSFYWMFVLLILLAVPKKTPFILRLLLTQALIALSTLCFLVPKAGFFNLLNRLFSFGSSSFHLFQTNTNLSSLEWALLFLALVFMAVFESFDKKSPQAYLNSKILVLIFLIAFAGQFESGQLFYMRL